MDSTEVIAYDYNDTSVTVEYCTHIALECEEKFPADNESMMSCFLDICFESQHLSQNSLILITVIFAAIAISGVIGNFAVCIVSKAQWLRHVTTAYLVNLAIADLTHLIAGNICVCLVSKTVIWLKQVTNEYLVNLAIANLMNLLAGLPFEIYIMWQQYPWDLGAFLCHFKGWLSEATTYVSVLTIVAFTAERYAAVCHSFQPSQTSNGRVNLILGLTWLVGGVCAIPYGLYHQVFTVLTADWWPLGYIYGPIEETRMCMLPVAFDPVVREKFFIVMHWSAVTFFALPLLIILVCYTHIGLVIHRSTNSKVLNGSQRPCQRLQHRKALIILAAVVVAFFVCYAPYQTQRLLFFYVTNTRDPFYNKVNHYLYVISGVFFYLGSTVNPLLYNVISARFRKAFKLLLACRLGLWQFTMLGSRRSKTSGGHKTKSPPYKTRLKFRSDENSAKL